MGRDICYVGMPTWQQLLRELGVVDIPCCQSSICGLLKLKLQSYNFDGRYLCMLGTVLGPLSSPRCYSGDPPD